MSREAAAPVARKLIAVAVVEHEGRFVVGQRQAGASLAGLWEFPGGKVEAGELPEAAAARECLEETGLAVEVQSEHSVVRHDYPHGTVELHFFRCAPLDPEFSPSEPFRWVDLKVLAELPFPEANRSLVDQLVGRALPRR